MRPRTESLTDVEAKNFAVYLTKMILRLAEEIDELRYSETAPYAPRLAALAGTVEYMRCQAVDLEREAERQYFTRNQRNSHAN